MQLHSSHRLIHCDGPFRLTLSIWIYSTREPIGKKNKKNNVPRRRLTDAGVAGLRLADTSDWSTGRRPAGRTQQQRQGNQWQLLGQVPLVSSQSRAVVSAHPRATLRAISQGCTSVTAVLEAEFPVLRLKGALSEGTSS